jgi:alkylation response protein AidB-like acyl-CoA dehydrogenase
MQIDPRKSDRVPFALSPEQSLLKDAVDVFVRDHAGTDLRHSDGAASRRNSSAAGYECSAGWRALADIGVLGLPFTAADGGLDYGPRELITVMESLGRGLCSEPVLEEVVIAGGLLARAGDEEQKRAWLSRLIAGQIHLALAHFEHTARFDLGDVRLRARTSAEGFVLDGEKTMVPLAAAADQWIVSAQSGNAAEDSIGFYLVTPSSAGIERRDYRLIDGASASAVEFHGVRANGRLRGGFADLAAVIEVARLAAGAEMVGLMSTLFESTIEYLKTREQFGRPLSSFQALQHRLADLYVRLEQSRSHLYRAAGCVQDDADRHSAVAGMKSYISRAAIELGEECVHLHGGIGTTDDLAIGRGYKRLLLLANLFGDPNSELVRFNRLQNRR